jgi:hypothetical protein
VAEADWIVAVSAQHPEDRIRDPFGEDRHTTTFYPRFTAVCPGSSVEKGIRWLEVHSSHEISLVCWQDLQIIVQSFDQ